MNPGFNESLVKSYASDLFSPLAMKILQLPCLLSFTLVFTACQTTEQGMEEPFAEASPGYVKDMLLLAGLQQEAVLEQIGSPEQRVSTRYLEQAAEVWIYSELIRSHSTSEIVDFNELTYVDQNTGASRTVKTGVTESVVVKTYWVTELIFVDGTLRKWNEGELDKKAY